MAFLSTSTITFSCLASAAPQADSWWLGHVVPDDVIITDIAGQALDIFLHGPESAHKNGILKTFTHTSIPIHAPKTNKKQNPQLTYRDAFLCLLPVQHGGGRQPGSLADSPQDWSTSDAFLPRTVLIQNICRCVHQRLHHCPATMPLSNNLENNPFLPGLSSSSGWLLVTRSHGDWWRRYHRHCRSGPRHFSPQSAHKNGIIKANFLFHMHSHSPMRTPKTKKEQNPQLTKHDAFV